MKIAYIHKSSPDTEKIYDTVESLKNSPFIKKSQEVFDAEELIKFSADMNIITYRILPQ